MWITRAIVGLTLIFGCAGCGAQLLAGTQLPKRQQVRPAVLSLGTRFVETRSDGPYLASDLMLTLPPIADAQLQLRHVALGGGYRWLLYPFSLEFGAQLGAGEPAFADWRQTAVFLGAQGSVLYRLSGDHDSLVGYAPAGLLLDAVATAGAGVWSRSGARASEDFSVLVGLRVTFISDIAVSSDQGWVPPP